MLKRDKEQWKKQHMAKKSLHILTWQILTTTRRNKLLSLIVCNKMLWCFSFFFYIHRMLLPHATCSCTIYLSSLRGESNQTPNLSWHFHSYVNKIQHWIVWGNALAGICEHNDQLQDEYMSWQHASHSYSTSFPHKSDILLGLICGTWSVTCLMSSRTQFMWCPLG